MNIKRGWLLLTILALTLCACTSNRDEGKDDTSQELQSEAEESKSSEEGADESSQGTPLVSTSKKEEELQTKPEVVLPDDEF